MSGGGATRARRARRCPSTRAPRVFRREFSVEIARESENEGGRRPRADVFRELRVEARRAERRVAAEPRVLGAREADRALHRKRPALRRGRLDRNLYWRVDHGHGRHDGHDLSLGERLLRVHGVVDGAGRHLRDVADDDALDGRGDHRRRVIRVVADDPRLRDGGSARHRRDARRETGASVADECSSAASVVEIATAGAAAVAVSSPSPSQPCGRF